jgi:hypothetical protein
VQLFSGYNWTSKQLKFLANENEKKQSDAESADKLSEVTAQSLNVC